METQAKLIHKARASYLPTAFPTHYYGMPNGKIILVYSRFYKAEFGASDIEFVFAEHEDFSYDYSNETIVPCSQKKSSHPVFAEQVDYPRAKINVFTIKRELNSYGEAQFFLEREAEKMLNTA